MSISRILAILVTAAFVGFTALTIYQAVTARAMSPATTQTRTTQSPLLEQEARGILRTPQPCAMDLGTNYYDGRLHGTPSPGQLGVNYMDGKVHRRDLPLFTPDNETPCRP